MKQKTFLLVSQALPNRHAKQTSKNVAYTTYKNLVNILNSDSVKTFPKTFHQKTYAIRSKNMAHEQFGIFLPGLTVLLSVFL